ncbi:hypothetical protein V6N12_001007 [Hibiscus sabdariffa]|uniref:Uncharacterized protein n=1 Tax=Hibiscus sabdariffa TaxID=183260 RepID=A0ABR2AY51_9ROSI
MNVSSIEIYCWHPVFRLCVIASFDLEYTWSFLRYKDSAGDCVIVCILLIWISIPSQRPWGLSKEIVELDVLSIDCKFVSVSLLQGENRRWQLVWIMLAHLVGLVQHRQRLKFSSADLVSFGFV